ncbi:hypothetical protein JQ581_30005 [Bradyrhizobium liaoningense]|uniref:hypothetical protein n=1 Tax=Bradyrhizobium liaoningense TaxID=43992 RepID=UPI001BA65381|nr:hypothetical protein [Bradyrhizobium liaoningense]MBR0741174.1 hypothetical protein [Bradyrhizobium liaoningense]
MDELADLIDKLVTPHIKQAIRQSRDHALERAIDLCALIAKHDGPSSDCVEQLTKLRNELSANDLTEDALERARH